MENGKWKEELVDQGKSRNICARSFDLGIRLIKLCLYLDSKPGTCRTLAGQILRAGTSVGSNVEEGQAAQSRRDFISKYSIALKEARETVYRLRQLVAAEVVSEKRLGLL